MEKIKDDDRRKRLQELEDKIQDPRSVASIDSLLDTVQALVSDCDHPCVKRMKNVEAYTNRCKLKPTNKNTCFTKRLTVYHMF